MFAIWRYIIIDKRILKSQLIEYYEIIQSFLILVLIKKKKKKGTPNVLQLKKIITIYISYLPSGFFSN